MSDLVPSEQPTGEVTPLRPKPTEPQNSPAHSNLAPPWPPGQSGNPAGRPRGSRSKLSESFLSDFHTVWEEEGLEAIRRCARNDPSTFVRVAASLLPHDINLNVGLNAETFVANFRQAVALLGNELPPSRRSMKVIDVDDADHH
jgi:Family of unknown function (DUF5681)